MVWMPRSRVQIGFDALSVKGPDQKTGPEQSCPDFFQPDPGLKIFLQIGPDKNVSNHTVFS
jgi:hypothetical protein